jgi:anti-anti-sigma factor
MTDRSPISAEVLLAELDVRVCAEGLVVSGRVDARSAARLRAALHEAIGAASAATSEGVPTQVLLDLSQATIGDATGLGVIMGAHHRARQLGARLLVVAVSARIARLLRLAHVDRALGAAALCSRSAVREAQAGANPAARHTHGAAAHTVAPLTA